MRLGGLIMTLFGLVMFAVGFYLVHELLFKFIKFGIGAILILISLALIFGGSRMAFYRYRR